MVTLRTSLAALFLVLGACDVGEVPAGGGGGGTPDAGGGGGGGGAIVATAAGFDAKVKPLIDAKSCALAGCHGGTTQKPNLTSFAALADEYKTPPGNANKLVIHVAAGAAHGVGTWFSTTEMDTVAAWIDNR